MTGHRRIAVLGALTALALVTPLAVAGQATDSARFAELERRIEAITRELERQTLGGDVVAADSAMRGLGPAASKVYRVDHGVSLGGYGEFLYENYAAEREDGAPSGATNQLDALRAIIYVGYKFSDRLLFNSEIEVEHANEIYLEFAYVDYLLAENVGVRAGMLLMPMGLVNELHEPPVFLGTERPVTENSIIPTTWRENGIGLFGGNDDFSWRAYVVNGFNGEEFAAGGLRGGRQKGSRTLANDLAFTGRLDYTGTLGLLVGASAYTGESAQNRMLGAQEIGGRVTVTDVHADFRRNGFEVRALAARARLPEADELNQLNGLTGADGVGEELRGGYVQIGYDIFRPMGRADQFIPYVRFERVNTHHEVPAGYTADAARDQRITSIGFSWKPVPEVVAKADWQRRTTGAMTGVSQWNLGLGWLF